ncbi:MAG TPA: M28 family metallopeptidase [Candidatus Acidoferrum sp.]|nr:M28 family metallopeptidase [Candidatus Acidoferrum sp.]
MPIKVLSAAAFFAVALSLTAQSPQPARRFDGQSWWNHVKFLADDSLGGRETGSEGLRKAESYVVDQFSKARLQPVGIDGFYQPVKFVSRQIVEKDSSASLIVSGKTDPLTLGEDACFATRAELSSDEVTASLAFVGYGLQIPEKNYDDLSGLDLHGKIIVYLAGSPSNIPTALASHYQTIGERWKSLKQAGVIGVITIPNPASMDIPWSRMSLNRAHPSMDLIGPEFDETQGLKMAMIFNPAQAEKLFAASGHTFTEIAAVGKDRQPLPHFPLQVSLKAHASVKTTPVESANIIGKLPGNDPALKNEYVVISAHVDHIGIGEPLNGDRIYNGAMDNASGVAVLLDLAAKFNAHSEQLRRSILFVIVTAEEKGLLGSKYFAAHPTVPPKSMIADINLDMFLPIVPLKVLKVPGLQESDLGDRAREAAQLFGVRVQPDPEPLRNVFIRSDQYNFIRHGVPALKLDFGYEPGSPEQRIFKDWLTNRYHAPSDDTSQPVDLAAAGLFEDIVRQLLISVANTDAKPQWKADSFFRRYSMEAAK